jgi:hypothetical protein
VGKTLGPFPKTVRWHEIVARSLPPARQPEARAIADDLLTQLQALYEGLTKDEAAIRVTTFLVALPVSTRSQDPVEDLYKSFNITVEDPSNLESALEAFVPVDCLVRRAAVDTIRQFSKGGEDALFATDPWARWREADGSAFCDLARLFFTNLNRHYFAEVLGEQPEELDLFAHEMSLITRSFSARWFNACARYQTPEQGSITWYLRHCLGKLDLELDREHSDWVEPTGNPWRRKKKVEASLGI